MECVGHQLAFVLILLLSKQDQTLAITQIDYLAKVEFAMALVFPWEMTKLANPIDGNFDALNVRMVITRGRIVWIMVNNAIGVEVVGILLTK